MFSSDSPVPEETIGQSMAGQGCYSDNDHLYHKNEKRAARSESALFRGGKPI
jgi:hypothetical protein